MRPVVGSVAERLYATFAPIAQGDEANGWPLLTYLGAVGSMFQEIEDLAGDTDEGIGWSGLVDVTRTPNKALAWLGTMVGVRLLPQLATVTTDAYYAQMRARVQSTDGFNRGTPAALIGAAQQHLTGDKYVLLNEREGGNAWQLGVLTRASETPDENAVRAALLEQKPAGIVLDYATYTGNTYQTLRIAHDLYSDVLADYTDYDDVRTHP